MIKYNLILIILLSVSAFSCTNSKSKLKTSTGTVSEIDMEKGSQIYRAKCMNCHKKNGEGLIRTYPPLAHSDFLENKLKEAIQMVKYGSSEPIKVNGKKYRSYMPASGLNDQDLQLVFNYILNSWGNQYGTVNLETIKGVKEKR